MFVYHATPPRRFASRAPNFQGFIYGQVILVLFFLIHPTITLSINNQIALCSYYIQLFATLFEQLRTIVDTVMHRFFDCSKLRYTRARCRQTLLLLQEAIKILTGSTKY